MKNDFRNKYPSKAADQYLFQLVVIESRRSIDYQLLRPLDSFIATREGWLYLAVILDLFSRQVIGWAMSTKNNSLLVQDALTMALWRRRDARNVVVHSDQGATYASGDYQRQLEENQLQCSMSRKGECLDNAVAESFFGSLKNELVHEQDYRNRAEARQSIFEYIEIFYNRKRRHAFLNYMTPVEYERKHA